MQVDDERDERSCAGHVCALIPLKSIHRNAGVHLHKSTYLNVVNSSTVNRGFAKKAYRRHPPRLYAFVVLALAAFLIVVACRREGDRRYQAAAVLHRFAEDNVSSTFTANLLAEKLTKDEVLIKAIQDLRPQATEASRIEVDAVRSAITVEAVDAYPAADFRVGVSSDDPEFATAVVNRICRDFVEQQKIEVESNRKRPSTQERHFALLAQEAEANCLAANRQREQFIEESLVRGYDVVRDATPNEAEASPTLERDPALAAALAERLVELQRQRHALLVSMTDRHPQVTSLTNSIAALQAQLAAIETDRSTAADASRQGRAKEDLRQRQATLAEYERLNERVAYARQQYEQVRQTGQRLAQQADEYESTGSTAPWQLSSADNAWPVYQPVSPILLLMAGIVGLISGGGAMRAIARDTIDSVAGAESAMDAPVLGTLKGTGVDSDNDRLKETSWLARCLVPSGEVVLFGFVAAMIAAALIDDAFAKQFRGDPMAALVDGVRHVVHSAWS